MQVEVKNLSFVYNKKMKSMATNALKNVSLTVDEGDFLGIIGHTGSGKSTLVQHFNGLIKTTAEYGSIKIGEFNLTDKKCDFKSLRAKVGMVFQYPEYQLFAETVYEDVEFGVKNFLSSVTEEERRDLVKQAIELVGLNFEEVKDKSPFELSGGQKRRVAIAGVIVTKPEILVLDEPVAGLDPQGKKDFLRLLKTLHGGFVKTIIIVSHDMNVVSEYCNKVAVFSKGEIIKFGTPKQVFSDSELLYSIGLDLPLTAKLTNALKLKGVIIDTDFTLNDFISKSAIALKKGVE